MKDKGFLVQKLSEYFKGRRDVAFAYLFGSTAKGTSHSESDIDVGVYFTPFDQGLEYESSTEYPAEDEIWSAIEHLTGRQTDLVVLNRAPATLFYAVFQTGMPLGVNDEGLRLRLYLAVSDAAEEYRDFVDDYYKISERSHSMTPIDKERLQRLVRFLETEMNDFKTFADVSQRQYEHEIGTRRNLERWAENMVNASIDIAKTLLASEKRAIPQTYKTILEGLMVLEGFTEETAKQLAQFSKMRNLLAHEYLDLRFSLLQKFVKESEPAYADLIHFVKKIMET